MVLSKCIDSLVLLFLVILGCISQYNFVGCAGHPSHPGLSAEEMLELSMFSLGDVATAVSSSPTPTSTLSSSSAAPSCSFEIGDLALYNDDLHVVITSISADTGIFEVLSIDTAKFAVTGSEIRLLRKAAANCQSLAINLDFLDDESESKILPKMRVRINEGIVTDIYHVLHVLENEGKAFIQNPQNFEIFCHPLHALQALELEDDDAKQDFYPISETEESLEKAFENLNIDDLIPKTSSSPAAPVSPIFFMLSSPTEKIFIPSDSSSESTDIPELEFPDEITIEWIDLYFVPYLTSVRMTIELIRKVVELYHPVAIRDLELNRRGVVKRLYLNEGESVTVVGDVHGQYDAIISIFDKNAYPSESNKYIFNGDFVDRGAYSIECLLLLYLLKVAEPDGVFLNAGNHETRYVVPERFARQCQFLDSEVDDSIADMPTADYAALMSGTVYSLFQDSFTVLSYATIIQDLVFVTHGGVSEGMTLAELETINVAETLTPHQQRILFLLLWNDPMEESGIKPSHRGSACQNFGPDITRAFLEQSNFRLLVRSHEFCERGFRFGQDLLCMTVFSAPNYCGVAKNTGAYVTFNHKLDMKMEYFK